MGKGVIFNNILEEKFGLKVDKPIKANNLLEALDKVSIAEGYFLREKEGLLKFFSKSFPVGKNIRVLSVGCGRGEEVYTIKYICSLSGIFCYVVGLDMSLKNLTNAKIGIYTSYSLRGMKENFLIRWGSMWRVPPNIQSNVDFVLGNILNLPFKDKSFDALICRNVLIYIKKERLMDVIRELKRVGKYLHFGMFDQLLLKNEGINLSTL